MLEHLFGSKTRTHLLSLFLNHPNRSYFVRELTREIGAQINAVRQELEKLEKMEVVVSDTSVPAKDEESEEVKMGGREKKYYKININFILYPELKALFLKSQFLFEKNLIEEIQKIGTMYLFILTGSFIGCTDSSTDMLLVGNINRSHLASIVERFEKEFHQKIDYTVLSLKEFKYRREITDRFLYNILENDKKIIVEDKIGI